MGSMDFVSDTSTLPQHVVGTYLGLQTRLLGKPAVLLGLRGGFKYGLVLTTKAGK